MNLSKYPIFLVLMIQTGMAMLLPAFHAFSMQSHTEARSFLYAGILLILISIFIGIAVKKVETPQISQRNQLLILLGSFAVLPIFMAIPFQDAVQKISFLEAYFEMASSFTTTGASLFSDPLEYTISQHLWRAEVAWLGGYVILVAAVSILAPMHLGGYEVIGASGEFGHQGRLAASAVREGATGRIGRWSGKIFPIYTGVTGLLWFGLVMTGQDVSVALIHAMSVLSTSGISPVGGFGGGQFNFLTEALVCLFALAGLSRLMLLPDNKQRIGLLRDKEIRLGLLIAFVVPLLLLFRHWVAAIEYGDTETVVSSIKAFWGGLFTSVSFLTTTGFVSAEWSEIALWSGLGSPGILLAGLAIVGGGVATTAGGVKLLRVYALFGQGKREMDKLVYPSSIGHSGSRSQRIALEGTRIAWVFFMLYALTIAVVMTALAFLGVNFEQAAILAVSALSTTGPLAEVATSGQFSYGMLPPAAQMVLIATMIVGRLEALALIALFNRDFWRS
ncbi:MAG: potassium transporter TrkG [Paracoccaceae bacterium]|nr:potassium transporter TrkG [Paracoccaceae bacterium]MDG2259110.1 potassium transporter TrkG [Paracoccaceae bacterium]